MSHLTKILTDGTTPSPFQAISTFLICIIVNILWRVIYNLYFHPLSKFPGPKIAAITPLYEYYFDLFKHGMYIWEIEKMHAKYG
jgi:hypothetical protein